MAVGLVAMVIGIVSHQTVNANDTTETAEQTINLSALQILTKAPPTITPTPTEEPTPYVASGLISFSGEIGRRSGKSKNYPVYTGPSETYYQVGNSNVYFGGDIGCAGVENGWYLIWYDYVDARTKKKTRKIGWTKAFTSDTENVAVPTLQLDYINMRLATDCQLTDGKDYYGDLKIGQSVCYLCLIKSSEIVKGTEKMAYVEVEIDGKKRRGLIPYDCIKWVQK